MNGFNKDLSDPYQKLENVYITAETDKAFLLSNDNFQEQWVPKSIVKVASQFYGASFADEIEVREWFCKQRGMY